MSNRGVEARDGERQGYHGKCLTIHLDNYELIAYINEKIIPLDYSITCIE